MTAAKLSPGIVAAIWSSTTTVAVIGCGPSISST